MGERFGEYEIEGRLGAGGMAEVYVARRAGPEGFVKRVCLKRVLADVEASRDAIAQFHDEARLCAHLHHPAIAAVHELGQVGGKWFMAMELVDGLDLRTLSASLRARGAVLPADVAVLVVRSVAEALAYAHTLAIDGQPAGLVHRDVTPSNVLLSVHGEVKLADFGIARSSVRSHRTRSGVVKGKVPYMAPEQALGERLDPRTDLFALGVLAYELFAGRRPHDGQTDLDTLTNAQRGRRVALREAAPAVPPEVAALVERMLASRIEDRPASADEVARVLGAIPARGDARRTLARLVEETRRARMGAPPTRIRVPGRQAAPVAERTPVASSRDEDERPTEVGAPVLPERDDTAERSSSMVSPKRTAGRGIFVAAALALAGALGAVVVAAVVIVVASDRFSHAVADVRPAAVPIEAVEPAKPPHEALVPPAPTPVPATPPATIAPAPEPGPSPSPTRHHGSARAPSAPQAPPPTTTASISTLGRIQVVAVPFGDVSLDDRPLGRAPVAITVESGPHEIVVTSGTSRIERHVTVEPGATERVVVDLL